MQRNPLKRSENKMTFLLITLALSMSCVGAQYYSDYSDEGGGGLSPYDIPVIYKQESYPPAFPVAPTIYEMTLMKPIEAMSGKKTVPLYIVPEDSIFLNSNTLRRKRSLDPHGLNVNVKYPEFFGLTDGFHIPAVEIPLNKPMIVRQIEVNVLAPEGFMVPFHSEDRNWPFPMSTGCLVASIPGDTYVGDDHPITIKRLFAVPSLPQYPTYRPAFPNGRNQVSYPGLPHHAHAHIHAPHSPHRPPHSHPHRDGVTLNIFQQGQQAQRPTPKAPVFELVPVTPKGGKKDDKRRRNGKKRDESEEDSDRSDEDSKDSREDDEEDDRKDRRRGRDRDRRRNGSRRRNRDMDDDRKTTTTSTTTTTRPTTTTTTPTTTTPAASSIQDIIAAFSSYRDRERERDDKRSPISASFYEEEERDRSRISRQRDNGGTRSREGGRSVGSRNEGLRSVSSEEPSRERDRYRDEDRSEASRERERPSSTPRSRSRDNESEKGNRPSSSNSQDRIEELREQVLQRQINQLQRLLTTLNVNTEGGDSSSSANSNGNGRTSSSSSSS